jgi:hypothetical protein
MYTYTLEKYGMFHSVESELLTAVVMKSSGL